MWCVKNEGGPPNCLAASFSSEIQRFTGRREVLPLLMKEVIGLKDWSDWGEAWQRSWQGGWTSPMTLKIDLNSQVGMVESPQTITQKVFPDEFYSSEIYIYIKSHKG